VTAYSDPRSNPVDTEPKHARSSGHVHEHTHGYTRIRVR
jgi:hypothetical protein